jgi:hypothetical protein
MMCLCIIIYLNESAQRKAAKFAKELCALCENLSVFAVSKIAEDGFQQQPSFNIHRLRQILDPQFL